MRQTIIRKENMEDAALGFVRQPFFHWSVSKRMVTLVTSTLNCKLSASLREFCGDG